MLEEKKSKQFENFGSQEKVNGSEWWVPSSEIDTQSELPPIDGITGRSDRVQHSAPAAKITFDQDL